VFIDLIQEAFGQYASWQKQGDRRAWDGCVQQLRERVAQAITSCWSKDGQRLLRNLRDNAQQWWYFLEHPEIPPDNNAAERALRLTVTKRKVSGGSRSMARFQQTADLLSVVQTCRRQQRSVMTFFCQALQAIGRKGFAISSLSPLTNT
jgi:transposase